MLVQFLYWYKFPCCPPACQCALFFSPSPHPPGKCSGTRDTFILPAKHAQNSTPWPSRGHENPAPLPSPTLCPGLQGDMGAKQMCPLHITQTCRHLRPWVTPRNLKVHPEAPQDPHADLNTKTERPPRLRHGPRTLRFRHRLKHPQPQYLNTDLSTVSGSRILGWKA